MNISTLTTLASKSFVSQGLFILALIALATLPSFTAPYFVIIMSTILMYVVLTVSWALFSGPAGYISLASAAFFGVGVYTSAVIGRSMAFPLVIIGAAVVSFVLAFLVGLVTLRLKGIYFAMFTFGLVELVRNLLHWYVINISNTVGRIVVSVDNVTVFYAMLIIFALVIVTAHFLRESKYGLALQSIGQNEEAAAHIGVNVNMVKIVIFALSAFFMGATGSVMATKWTYIDPTIAFNPLFSFLPVLMAIFGGTSTLFGPVLGATLFTLLEEFLATTYPYFYMFLIGMTLIIVILYLPNGIIGLFGKIRERLNNSFQNEKNGDVVLGHEEVTNA